MNEILVSFSQKDVITLTLNRPEKRNALNRALIDQLLRELDTIESRARVLILEGSGSNFCSGIDVNELSSDLMERVGELFLKLAMLQIPTVAYVHGAVAAGGVGLVAACDLAIAHKDAAFFLPELEKGIAPLLVEVLLRKVLSERHFKELAFTGLKITAEHALTIGLVNSLGKENMQPILEGLLKCNPKAFQRFKKHLNSYKHLEIEFAEALKVQQQLLD